MTLLTLAYKQKLPYHRVILTPSEVKQFKNKIQFLHSDDLIFERVTNLHIDLIASDAILSYLHARYVLKDEFKPGEHMIATDYLLSSHYAFFVIKRRFPLGEPAIENQMPLLYEYYTNKFGITA